MSTKPPVIGDDLFKRIHQLQVSMIQETSKASINAYRRQLFELFESGSFGQLPTNQDDLNNLVEFLTFPVLASIKRLLSEYRELISKGESAVSKSSRERLREFSDLSELLLNCIRFVFEHVEHRNEQLFYEVLNMCSILLSLRSKSFQSSPAHPISLSEEFFIECLRLIQALFRRTNDDSSILESFYRFSNLTSLGLLVSVFLDLVVQSTSFQVRIEALEAFKSISAYKPCQLTSKADTSSEACTKASYDVRIGSIFASFLPGICIKLIQGFLLSQNLKLLNHKLICCSLQLLTHMVAEILSDDLLDEAKTKAILDSCMPKPSDKRPELSNDVKAMIVNRGDSQWLDQSAEKVSILLERLFDSLVLSDNSNVQMDLVKFSAQICNRCYFTLNKFLPNCLKVLVTLVDPDEHEASEAAQMVSRTLEAMEAKETEKNRLSAKTVSQFTLMSSCVDELLIELPRIMNRQFSRQKEIDDKVRIHHLKLLRGYLRLIGGKDSQLKDFLIANLSNLNNLLQALISCVWFDYKSLNNFYEVSVIDDQKPQQTETINANRLSNYAGLQTYLDDKSVFDELSKICAYLARTDAFHLIVDEFITNDLLFLQRHQNRTEIMFLVNLMLISATERCQASGEVESSSDHVVRLVLENFLDDHKSNSAASAEQPARELNGLDDEANENYFTMTPTTKKNRQIIQTCLVLEAISALSKCQMPASSHSFLISTIFFCLENYLNSNLLIRAVSAVCLKNLAKNLQYKSIQDLLSSNYDYIMNDLILRSFNQFRSAKSKIHSAQSASSSQAFSSHVYILCSLLQISNTDLVPFLDRLVNDYIASVEARSYDTDLLNGMCKIIYQMSRSMRSWYPVKVNFMDANNNLAEVDDLFRINLKDYSTKSKKLEYNSNFLETVSEIEDQLNKFRKNQEFLAKEEPVNEDDPEDEEPEPDQDEEEKSKKVPLNVQLQTKCLTLCSHLISHPFRQIRIAVIDIICELCVNLAEHTNEFLPIVHKLWSPVCKRFLMDDLVVKCKIVQLLFELSVLCPDFLTSRFGKEFLPYLCQFMNEQAKVSAKHGGKSDGLKASAPSDRSTSDIFSQKGTTSTTGEVSSDATYIYSQAFKLQCAILNNLDKMCVLFEIKELELESLIDASIAPYLDKKQPKKLQQSAVAALKNVSLIDSDIVWMSLHYVIPFSSPGTIKSLLKADDNCGDKEAICKARLHASDLCLKQSHIQLTRDTLLDLMLLFNEL